MSETEALAAWMIANSYATGHGDTIESLIAELDWQHKERANKVLDGAAKVAQVQLERWTKHTERATKRANSGALLKAVGYQGEPELEQIEAESFRDMAGTILDGILALKVTP